MPTKSRRKRSREKPSGAEVPTRKLDVAGLREELGLTRRLFARLTGYSERALADWEGGRELSEPSRQRMVEMQRLQAGLARVMQPDFIGRWLQSPNDAFGGLKPIEVVERGEIDRLWKMIHQLESGQPG